MSVAKFGGWVVGAIAGRVLRGVGGTQHFDGLEGLFAGGMEDVIAAVAVHGFKGAGGGRG